MRDDLFNDLVTSIRQAGAIMREEAQPSRVFHMDKADAADIREKLGLSQSQFASLLGISVGTLRNWEQGRRKPEGPAKVLLQVAARYPYVLLDLVIKGQATLSSMPENVKATSTITNEIDTATIPAPFWPRPERKISNLTDQGPAGVHIETVKVPQEAPQ
jgi:putative transcriptional regulator